MLYVHKYSAYVSHVGLQPFSGLSLTYILVETVLQNG